MGMSNNLSCQPSPGASPITKLDRMPVFYSPLMVAPMFMYISKAILFSCRCQLPNGLAGVAHRNTQADKADMPACAIHSRHQPLADGSFETSRSDTVRPSSW